MNFNFSLVYFIYKYYYYNYYSSLILFRLICKDLLSKTSDNIKIKSKNPNKSLKHQSQQPLPQKNQISIDDVYEHLKRQPYHYGDYYNQYQYQTKQYNDNNDDNDEAIIETKNGGNVLMGYCHDNDAITLNLSNEQKSDEDIVDNELINNNNITLMGHTDNGDNGKDEQNENKNKNKDKEEDKDADSLIVSNCITMMGFENNE